MTYWQRIAIIVLGTAALGMTTKLLMPHVASTATPASEPQIPERDQVTAALTMCDLAMSELGDQLAGQGDVSELGRYQAAVRAEAECKAAYLHIGKLPRSDLTTACEEEMSVKYFAADRAVRLFADTPTPRKLTELQDAVADVPAAAQACATALSSAKSGS